MAKRGGKPEEEEEESYEFIPPDFDEDAFIHKEMVSFKTTMVLFFWGILAGLLTWAIYNSVGGGSGGWYTGLLVCAATGAALRFIFPLLKIDVLHFGRKEWLGTGFLFFFTWLATMIIVLNPPISDHAPPAVDLYVSPAVQQAGGDVTITVFFLDNDKVEDHEFQLLRGTDTIPLALERTAGAPGRYEATATDLVSARYTYTATATDPAGHSTEVTGNFSVSRSALRMEHLPDTLSGVGDTIIVRAPEQLSLRTVYMELTTGAKIHMQQDSDRPAFWEADPDYAGWQRGDNSFIVVAEERNRFNGNALVEGGRLLLAPDSGTYSIEVATEPGDFQVNVAPPRVDPPVVNVPGPGLVVLLLGLVGAAFVARRR